ncbi:MAG: hypothetical protein ABSB97_05780 [Thermoplasmata archaeon]|jgi:uncharacterized membrane protein YeaQ/YmgE (transglycosylase-associated protein family)
MILPGLVSLAFYKRKPTVTQVVLGLAATVLLSAVLGYISPGGPLGQEGSVIVAVIGGVILYFAILAYLYHRYRSRHAQPSVLTSPPPAPEVEERSS